ncbi:MAG: 4-hydroxythreonine-4-phosphate dehydrogenase [Arcobacter sp.]|jgi:4-hydroxythreonine-4-phosphate dehydrogenase|uniref:4-hydroxythreonine-4-phosphate dehydrogenase n=1 Tax=Arcobacter defluvii TaxID=873191 RepID=A0AAE7BFN8_9BACT|nr:MULTISPECIES: 4-hydroxythreonine-4-phosphate dehydrogenase [Arcobacter]MDY3201249.1 4-hydroxythreonine-4-phosphate dehydrogenase [Arcobacter sp.]QKF76847.1 4-hydroxy-L-threonine phosphate dehydrogenase, NAD-dependent [Arcobacter defluvii]RXI33814.1 4-hydroxythreonine-4-phosphate dehydrogenase PdxA [Arcobacter defluvii]BAK72666.1 4-hydroxythreonine-4-phosphate dehydrogenase [Arcobacter sp. L]
MTKELPKIAISIGDLNGIGIEIAFKCHDDISKICHPIYCINNKMLKKASEELKTKIPENFEIHKTKGEFEIKPGTVTKKSGKYSYDSFMDAINLANKKEVDAICTLPINKESWNKAGIRYKGHTEVLRDYFGKNAIMMLGCSKMFVALFTEHIALRKVAKKINEEDLTQFLIDFYNNVKNDNIGVLGLNPHASDNGVLGDEEVEIFKAIKKANKHLGKDIFKGPLVPDTAFSPLSRKNYTYFVAMYHDQGLAPLKALYFDESINVSLNLPIIRTSVDHGTAFNIAYKNENVNTQSYINAIKEAINLVSKQK